MKMMMTMNQEEILKLKNICQDDKYGGIYIIYNIRNNKKYIGSSVNVAKRVIGQHIRTLEKNTHKNIHLQRSYNINSKDFKFFLLEKVDDKNKLISKEQLWINFFESANEKKGYNISPTAGSMLGFKHSVESKKKISDVQKGKVISEETKRKMSEAVKGEKAPWYGKTFSEEHKKNLVDSRLGWKHTNEAKEKISEALKNRPPNPETYKKIGEKNKKPIIQLSLDGQFIRYWKSASDASKELNISSGNIRTACNGKRKTAGGFKWTYAANENKEDSND